MKNNIKNVVILVLVILCANVVGAKMGLEIKSSNTKMLNQASVRYYSGHVSTLPESTLKVEDKVEVKKVDEVKEEIKEIEVEEPVKEETKEYYYQKDVTVPSSYNTNSTVTNNTTNIVNYVSSSTSSKKGVTVPKKEVVEVELTDRQKACESAREYLEIGGYSRQGITDLLLFEAYSKSDVDYAVAILKADYNAEAVKCAKEYYNNGVKTSDELVNQLLYEGFTQNETNYAMSVLGY